MRLVLPPATAEYAVMRIRRFKVEDLTGPRVRVAGREAAHALRVLRLKIGAEVVLFDGRGHEVTGRLCSIAGGGFEVEVARRHRVDPKGSPALVIAAATPKGSRADWLVEKCAELGVRELWLLRSERGEVDPGEGKLARWRRKGVETAKQTGRALAMGVEPPQTIAEVVARATDVRIFYGDPLGAGLTLGEALSDLPVPGALPANVLIFIGPEGGLTDVERVRIEDAGGQAVRFSDATLRVETAAVAAASIWGAWILEAANE